MSIPTMMTSMLNVTDLSLPGHAHVFAIGDMAHFSHQDGQPLPGISPVAMQMGRHVARNIEHDLRGQPREPFRYVNKGTMATIGRKAAIVQFGCWKFSGFAAWVTWLVLHIYFLIGFRNRLIVLFNWACSFFTYAQVKWQNRRNHNQGANVPRSPVMSGCNRRSAGTFWCVM